MPPRERVLALLAGKPVDRPPTMPITMMWAADLIGAKYHDYATLAEIQVAAQCAAARQFEFDHVSVISDPCCEAADLGAAIFYPPDAPPAIIEEQALLADPATLRLLPVPDPYRTGSRMANRIEAVRLLRQQVAKCRAHRRRKMCVVFPESREHPSSSMPAAKSAAALRAKTLAVTMQ